MKVGLVICPQANPDKPPLALAYLGSYLVARDIEVVCFDFNIDLYSKTDGAQKKLWTSTMDAEWTDEGKFKDINLVDGAVVQGWCEQIEQAGPEIIGFSLLSTNVYPTLKLAKEIRKRMIRAKIIFGGPEAYRVYGCGIHRLFEYADALILGEGEQALFQAVSSIVNNGGIGPARGILVKKDDLILGGDTSALIDDINEIPFPDYDWFSLDKYKERGAQLPLIFSRGCIGKCSFCFERAYWQNFRSRSVSNVIAEIKMIRAKYGIWRFALNDSLFNGDMRFLGEFCDRVIAEDIKISWWGMARINSQMTGQFLTKMLKAGCVQIAYGVESGSQKVLNAMRKGYTVSMIDEALQNTFNAGIKLGVSLMLGFPGEEEEDFRLTCELIKRNGRYLSYANISTLGIEPFTDIHRDSERIGIDFKGGANWQTPDKRNNYQIRMERSRRLSEVVNEYVGKAVTFIH